ncbi:hypothetical protein [Armatimonas rosea]|uniref:Uncharacterized protein n=1 Tax=Armatimonas rosea TaxID=685828 RepID=A0A7W9SP87_ARMRO|nr:hypothetical protein [Armatimonas rosea]MBB6049499.1 hypothetical protein [Armatimonas rosea]
MSTPSTPTENTAGPWPRCPEAAAYFQELFTRFADQNPLVAQLAQRLAEDAGVDILALVDHWILPPSEGLTEHWEALGLVKTTLPEGDEVWEHPGARLPRLRVKAKRTTPCLALGVESIAAFAAKNDLAIEACHGDNDSGYQCAHLTLPHGELMPIVRVGYRGFAPQPAPDGLDAARTDFAQRPRTDDELATIAAAQALFEKHAAVLGRGRATEEFFAAERVYYLARNAAARWQYARQEAVGIGWANHDHHTYRCSRAAFPALIRLFVAMGFLCRERFYAGAEAGWGAQVLEHPESRVVIFADVDIAPEELDLDFAAVELAPRTTLGTIGLWCALHGSSIARAGMHHIECEFLCQKVKDDALVAGFGVMAPFTDLPMLWQAFTVGEPWLVPHERLAPLVAAGHLTSEQAEKFATTGALGSHLEILQRWEGFKGFNKTAVSSIIRDTDARLAP